MKRRRRKKLGQSSMRLRLFVFCINQRAIIHEFREFFWEFAKISTVNYDLRPRSLMDFYDFYNNYRKVYFENIPRFILILELGVFANDVKWFFVFSTQYSTPCITWELKKTVILIDSLSPTLFLRAWHVLRTASFEKSLSSLFYVNSAGFPKLYKRQEKTNLSFLVAILKFINNMSMF